MIHMIKVYIERWLDSEKGYLLGHMIFSAAICTACVFVCREDDVFTAYGSTKSFLFTILMAVIWIGIFNTISLYQSDSHFCCDEFLKFLPVSAYVLANLIIQFFLSLAEASICVITIIIAFDYPAAGITALGRSAEYFMTFFLVILSGDALGMAAGCAVKKINWVMCVVPILLIAQFLFSGCLFDLSGLMSFLSCFTTARWGLDALGAISELNSMTSPLLANKGFDPTGANLAGCWLKLFFIAAVCECAAGAFIYFQINKKK